MKSGDLFSRSALTVALLTSLPVGQALSINPADAATTGQNDAAVSAASVLLAQAKYWQGKGDLAQALASLKELLRLDPADVEALALKVKVEFAEGNAVSATRDLATLQKIDSSSKQFTQLIKLQTEAANPVDTKVLKVARTAAQGGDYVQAVALYQKAFHGNIPPSRYAVEYYQTLAGTPDGYAAGLEGLRNIVEQTPSDLQAQLAFASVETYKSEERQAGINRLTVLTNFPGIAHEAAADWKQALTFLPKTLSSIPAYQAYLAKYPDDAAVQSLVAMAKIVQPKSPTEIEGNDRASGFRALNANDLSKAVSLFQAALAINPNDADALGGMGLVRLRQGHTSQAQYLLRKAIAANPSKADQWRAALSGANLGADYAAAKALLDTGNYALASRKLQAIIAAGGNNTGAYEMLADSETRQGNLDQAAKAWRAVLKHDPGNGQALAGLGQILLQKGDAQGAEKLFEQAEASGHGALVANAQAEFLRARGAAAKSPTVALVFYRAAVAAAPDDPWARLDFARKLQATGMDTAALEQIQQLIDNGNPSNADLQAAALFYAGDGRLGDAEALVSRLPASAMTPAMQKIQTRAALHQQIASALAQGAGNPALTRQLLVTMAAMPDPDGNRGAAIATALVNAGDPGGAALAIQTAIAANPAERPAALLNYAGSMLAAGQDESARRIMRNLQTRNGLTTEQETALDAISNGLAVRASDRLAAKGKLAAAYDQLSPGLQRSPDNPALNTALARLYQDNHQPKQALAIDLAVLNKSPDDLDARAGAINAAVAAGDMKIADRLMKEGKATQPNEPRIWMMAANVEEAKGNDGVALNDLKTAQSLRQQQLVVASGGSPEVALASTQPVQTNPFASVSTTSDDGPSVLGVSASSYQNSAAPDPISQQISTQINELQQSQRPFVQSGIALESRSGSPGLDALQTFSTPIKASFSPSGPGKVAITVTPTYMLAGQVSNDKTGASKFGADALDVNATPENQSATGVGVDASYTLPWLKANIGGTPFGFRTENLIGGIELFPKLPGGVTLTIGASREPVTDSLLSYASTLDPVTGTTFGAVMRNRTHVQVTVQTGKGYVYIGGGADQLKGKHVESNNEIEFGAGGGYPFWQTDDSTATAGVNVTYFSYDKNLRYFTLGQGGYFSPQSYFAVTIPLQYNETDGDLSWGIGGTAGTQSYTENPSPYYPMDPSLQAELVAKAASSSYLKAYYPGDTNSSFVGGANAKFEYHMNNDFMIGGSLDYQRTANWNQMDALFYARYLLGGTADHYSDSK